MGRGLGELQKGILGLAWTVNAHTQGGEARAKSADPKDRVGMDYCTPLGVCLLYGIVPSEYVTRVDPRPEWGETLLHTPGFFASSPIVNRAKAATSRGARNLIKRGFLAVHYTWIERRDTKAWLGGYLLTETGMEIAEANQRPVPLIDETLSFFGVANRRSSVYSRRVDSTAAYIKALAAYLAEIKPPASA
jgi:hypothetical protein